MSIKVNLHVTHRVHTNGQETVKVNGSTVKEALHDLISKYPGLEKEVFNKKGEILHYIEIYLNKKSAYPDELSKALKPGDELQIITFLAGG